MNAIIIKINDKKFIDFFYAINVYIKYILINIDVFSIYLIFYQKV